MNNILGISAFYHDSAAALVKNGNIIAAAQEERFTRKKHDADFPRNAIEYCLSQADLGLSDLDCIVFYDKPLVKFERLIETYLTNAPKGINSFITAMPIWLKEKLYLKKLLRKELKSLLTNNTGDLPKLLFTEHHEAHAASAFYPSPFKSAAVLCVDGVGEWATTSAWIGKNNALTPVWHIDFPHSLGLLYSAFTYYTGFKVNSGEYKLMGLAPYGEAKFVDKIKDHLIDIKSDGSFRLNMDYFSFATDLRMTNEKFHRLFGQPRRKPESEISQFHMDIAKSVQEVTEEVMLRMTSTLRNESGEENLCMAGGVALNCVANGKILRHSGFKELWIQPAAGDAGGAVGAALNAWYGYDGNERVYNGKDAMHGGYLGPEYNKDSVQQALSEVGAKFDYLSDNELFSKVANLLAAENVIGWFQGRMEFGPRALGNRSIIGDPRSMEMQSLMNLKIKYRESFRPFAPSVLIEHVNDYFQLSESSPYMLIVAPVNENQRRSQDSSSQYSGLERLKQHRSTIPAVTHVDYSARVQTVHRDTNARYHALITKFKELTGCPLLINTSFNVRGEPIVATPTDAYRCFMRTEMDFLVIGNFLLSKKQQPEWLEKSDWRNQYELD